MTPTPTPKPDLDPRQPGVPLAKRRWHVGSLTYTAGGLAVLFCWLLWGDFAWNMKERAITPVAQLMLRGFSAPDWLVGLLVGSVPCAIGMFLGPVVSVVSDRHRGRWGRRIPFLLIPTPVVALAMFGLAVTPPLGLWIHGWLGVHSPGEMACRISTFAFFWAVFEIATIIVNTLFSALINDVVPQAIIGRFFALFRAVSLIAGVIFNFYLMGKASTHYLEIFLGLGTLYGVGFMLMCFKVKEGDYPPPPPHARVHVRSRLVAPVVVYLKECFSKPFYLWFFLANTLGNLALGPVNTFAVFHARSVGMSDGLYGKSLALSYTISLVLSYPLGILADRLHPLRLGIFAMSLYVGVTVYGFLYATSVWPFFTAYVLHTVAAGTFLTGTASISQRLLPSSRFAEFHSAAGIIGSICYMILPPALGFFIQFMNHDYRYVFLLGGILALASVVAYTVLFLRFLKLGGDKAYVAPE
jgi:MFS family permease